MTRPEDDGGYEDFRVFVGPKDDVSEQRVKGVERSKSGDTFITFDLDGAAAQAEFSYSYSPDGGVMPEVATLTVGAATQTLEMLDSKPDGAAYRCFGGR